MLVLPGICEELRAALNDGLLSSRSLAQLDYRSFDPAKVPPEFVATGRALVPDGEDFLVQNQSLYSILANEGDHFVEVNSAVSVVSVSLYSNRYRLCLCLSLSLFTAIDIVCIFVSVSLFIAIDIICIFASLYCNRHLLSLCFSLQQ